MNNMLNRSSKKIFNPKLSTGLMVFVDIYSRFPVIWYTKSTRSEVTIKALDNILAEFRNITQIDTDNAAPFLSK